MHGLHAGEFRLFEDIDTGNELIQVGVGNGAQTALVEAHEESQVASIGDPRHSHTIERSLR